MRREGGRAMCVLGQLVLEGDVGCGARWSAKYGKRSSGSVLFVALPISFFSRILAHL